MNLNGIGVEALDPQHGKEIIETFKALGVDVFGYTGSITKEIGVEDIFYGLIDGRFACRFKEKYSKIITLEELKSYLPSYNFKTYPQPKMMKVWDSDNDKLERPVFAEQIIDGHTYYWAFSLCASIDKIYETNLANRWEYAREIQPVVSITMDEAIVIVAKEKGVDPNNLVIEK